MKSRIAQSNPEDALQGRLVNQLYTQNSEYTRVFYFGQVINNNDPKNLGRIQVRIPIIDEIYYINQNKNDGDRTLPWCLPMSSRFAEAPEQNSIVIVALFDPKVPFFGRLFFDSITEISATELFERLTPEEKTLSNWLNAENSLDINNPKPKKLNEYEVKNKVIHKVGIRGKGNNKLELNEKDTILSQNYKDTEKESFLKLAETDSTLEGADNVHLLSKKGEKTEYNIVFDIKLFEYLDKINKMINKVVLLLNTTPAKSPTGPCLPGPNAKDLISEFKSLKAELKKFKNNGSSKKLWIN